ncbi:MAG: hypothetical protein KJN59_10525 [Bacteroidia bacterium]|nr:hypothetical protein [Bacteroidia bacterium]NNF81402.1 hypothetical protein [Flavobacteriaceae bacterium]
MLKNKNLNFAIIIFAITMSLLFAFVQYYPTEETSKADVEQIKSNNQDNLVITSN